MIRQKKGNVLYYLLLLPLPFSLQLASVSFPSPSPPRWKLVISFSSCFGGGVFIGACLLDLLPEVEEQFEAVVKQVSR